MASTPLSMLSVRMPPRIYTASGIMNEEVQKSGGRLVVTVLWHFACAYIAHNKSVGKRVLREDRHSSRQVR